MSAFIKMERATLKKQKEYEQANAHELDKQSKPLNKQVFEETGIRVRDKAIKSTLPS